MAKRIFEMRLSCRYEAPENTIADLRVESLEDGDWREFHLHTRSPGFEIFVYSILTCQHLYFRTNCAERGLPLESAEGSIYLLTSEDWDLQRLGVRFAGSLISGTASEEDIEYIVGRMKQCPVSRNIKEAAASETEVRFC